MEDALRNLPIEELLTLARQIKPVLPVNVAQLTMQPAFPARPVISDPLMMTGLNRLSRILDSLPAGVSRERFMDEVEVLAKEIARTPDDGALLDCYGGE
jgi:hypothetical protein